MSLLNMSTEELKAKEKELDNQIFKLKKELKEIKEIKRERKKEELKKYVGKCYAVRPYSAPLTAAPYKYTKIIGVPVEQYTMTSTIFNENQLPAVSFCVKGQNNILDYCYESEYGFDSDTVFLGSVKNSRVLYHDDSALYHDDSYEEITPEEFNEALKNHLKCLYDAVTSI